MSLNGGLMMPDQQHSQPDQLVDQHGNVHFGIFPGTLQRINGRQADYRTPMGKAAGSLQRHFHYKQFQYFGIISDTVLAGCALADTGWLGLAFFYLFDTETGQLTEYTWRSPLAGAITLSDSPVQGTSRFRTRGVNIEMGYSRNANGGLDKTLILESSSLKVDVHMHESVDYQPMSICTRTGINGWVYANKVAGLPVTGSIRHADSEIALAGARHFGHHDFSAGYMRRETFWNWACLSGSSDGRQIGLNLSCGVNETSFTENCLWLDQRLQKVDTVQFSYNRDDLLQPWEIESMDGRVSLRFTPHGRHREKMNLGVFASNFNQLFGCFDGYLKGDDGAPVPIRNMYGFVEEQYAKW